jgi:hypothetical protein
MKRLVLVLVLLLFVLHQDFWWWDDIDPLAFGFLPIGLTFHVILSLVTSVVLFMAVKHWWPHDVDVAEHDAAGRRAGPEL